MFHGEKIIKLIDSDLTSEKMILSRAAQRQNPVNGSLELLPLCNMNCDMCYIRLNKKEVDEQGGLHNADAWIQLGKEMAEKKWLRQACFFYCLQAGNL